PVAATADSGSWRPVAPATLPAGGEPRRGPDENAPLLPATFGRCLPARVIRLAADTARPPASVPPLCVFAQALQRAGSALPRSVLLCRRPRPAAPDNTAVALLPPWLARQQAPGASGPGPLLAVPARSTPSRG